MLSTSCRMVATRMMKKKNSWWRQGDNVSILFLNQHDRNHPDVLRIVVPFFVDFHFEDELLCWHILLLLHVLCAICHKFSLLLCCHRLDPRVHWHLQSSAQASTSFRFCFVLILSQCKNGPLMRSRHTQHKYVHPTLNWFVSPETAGISKIYPIWICNCPFVPSWVRCELWNKFFASQFVRVVLCEKVLRVSRAAD